MMSKLNDKKTIIMSGLSNSCGVRKRVRKIITHCQKNVENDHNKVHLPDLSVTCLVSFGLESSSLYKRKDKKTIK